MTEKAKQLFDEKTVWLLIIGVFVCVLGTLALVFRHEKDKPRSPQELVVTAFNQGLSAQKWNTGVVKQPFTNHSTALNNAVAQTPGMLQQPFADQPAGSNHLIWQPLPPRSAAGRRIVPMGGLQPGMNGAR